MSKELEALDKLGNIYKCKESVYWHIIETALKDYEKLAQKHNELLYNYGELVHCGLKSEQKKIQALDTIKRCNDECPDNNKIIRFSCYDRPSYISDEELHIDYLVIGNACFIISSEEKDCLKEVLL